MEANRGRGRGRARARGGSASGGRVRGRGQRARLLVFTQAGPSGIQPTLPSPARSPSPAPLGSSSQPKQSLAEQLKKVRTAKVADKKNLTVLSAQQRAALAEKRATEQSARYLLPDAPPPKKRNRKPSPTRVPCPLVPGTPETPPPRKAQAWEKSLPGTSTDDPCRELATPSPEWLDPHIFDDDGFLGHEEYSCDPGSDVVEEPKADDGNSMARTVSQRSSVINEEYSCDPGSDVDEEPEADDGNSMARTVSQRSSVINEEEIPVDLAHLLDEMGTRDDSALREAASSNPDMLNFDWSSDPEKFVGQQEVFSGDSGPTFSTDGLSPLDIFERIWDDDIINTIVRESNRYGRQIYTTANKLWTEITAHDIWTFLALIMLQSILILPVEREYWYPCLALLKVGNFQNIMSFKMFLKIKKCLHFVDNDFLRATGEERKLQKIWPIIEHLNKKFSSLYLPEQYIAIDESLLLWKGRLSFVQLIATKAARVGVKSYELCESRTGYLWKMLIYTGKGDKAQPIHETGSYDEPEGTTSKIVHNLVRPLLNKGHTLVMDNFYNSPLLSRTLKAKKTDTMGTLRLKREFVPEAVRNITKSNTRQGEVVYSQTEDLTISVWHDANIVAMLSTYHSSVVGGKEKYGTYRYKPQVVLDYNMTMGGVDKKDQMLQAFPVERVRNLVWYKKLFRRLLNVSIYNAFVIFNHNRNGRQRQFRVTLAKMILDKVQGEKPNPNTELRRSSHFPTKADTNRARCKMCFIKKVQTRTAYKCDTCNINLCIVGCFKEYHLRE